MTALQRTYLRSCAFVSTNLFLVGRAFAQDDLFGPSPDIGRTGTGTEEVREAIIQVLKTVLNFMALIAVVFIVIAGIRLVVSQGEEAEKDKAKKTIVYVIVGLVIIIFARLIVEFVASVLLEEQASIINNYLNRLV